MHRADLLKALRENLHDRRCTLHLNKKLVSYSQTEHHFSSVRLFFEDGTSADADVLIGADGINSSTRKTMFSKLGSNTEEQFASPSWTGTYCYRALVDSSKLRQAMPGHQATTLPIIVSFSCMIL